ncbi:MAG: LytR C-terminal domain-containing protein [bacterium]|nr:LytR C-terminal domain-containing protein [bacterium]
MKRWIWIVGLGAVGLLVIGINTQWQQRETRHPLDPAIIQNIRVEILNGCGKDGIATVLANKLRSRGLDVMTLGNADSYAFSETLVIDRVGKMHYAQQVADLVGTQNLIQQITPDPFRIEEVTVIIGRDYAYLPILKNP